MVNVIALSYWLFGGMSDHFLFSFYVFLDVLSRAGIVRAATIEEIEAEKSLIEKDAVSISLSSFIVTCSMQLG
jgi:hypothetical protein